MQTRTLALTAVLTLFGASAASAQDSDFIYVRGEEARSGKIVEMTFKEVKFENSMGVVQPVPSKDVLRVELDQNVKGFDFSDAERKLEGGEVAEARDKFERAMRDSRSPIIKQMARFYVVQCTFELKEWDRTIERAKAFRAEVPDSFYLRDSFMLQFAAARAKGSLADAEAALKDMETAATQNSMDDWRRGAGVLRAELAEAKGDWRAARSAYEQYSTDRVPEIAEDARLGLMRTLAAQKDWGTLSTRASTFIDDWKAKWGTPDKTKGDPPYRLAVASYLAKGKALLYGENKAKPAMMELLRASWDLGGKVQSCPEHQEALAQATVAVSRHAAEIKDKDERDKWRLRAEELVEELKSRYGGGPLLDLATSEVKKVPR